MTTLPLALAHSAATPPRILTALARDPQQGGRVQLALAENAALPADALADLAENARSEALRRALLRNPAVDAATAATWLAHWANASVAVWREAIRHLEDPDGALARDALQHFPASPWLPTEILESDTTSENARLQAALTLVSAPNHRLKQTERDRITDLAHRLPGTADAVLAAATDPKLTTALTPLAAAPAELPTNPRVGDLAAWLAGPITEDAALGAMAGQTRADLWRITARAIRPQWATLAAAVVTAARAALTTSPTTAYSIGNALLNNPSAPRASRARAAALVAASPTTTGYKPLRRIQRAARTAADRNAVARTARSPEVLRWLAAECADLSPDALARLARTVAALDRTGWSWWTDALTMRGLLSRPTLPPDARDALLRSAGWQAAALLDTGTVDAVLTLPWHDTAAVADTHLPALDGYRIDVDQATLVLAARLGQALHDPTGAGWGDLPSATLALTTLGTQPVVDGLHGELVMATAARAAELAGHTVDDATITHVMGVVVSGGFTGTLQELATVVGASLRAA